MKKIIYILLLSFTSLMYSQDKNKNDYKILVDSAIVIYGNNYYKFYELEQTKKLNTDSNWKYYLEEFKKRLENIYLIDENGNPLYINNNYSKIKFKQMFVFDKKNRNITRKEEFGIKTWKVIPKLEENRLNIKIVDCNLNYKDNEYFYKLDFESPYTIITFEYSCSEKKWIRLLK
jgi:uncharacterized protein YnzC (UPF0291/DUF896 family)